MSRIDDPHPFIHRYRAAGMSDELIYQRLLLDGWAAADVAPIFIARGVHVEESVASVVEKEVKRTSRSLRKHASIAGIFIALFAGGIGASFAYSYAHPPVVYSISLPLSDASTTPALGYGALPALSDPDYFQSVMQKMIDEKASFIEANLSTMQLEVYTQGALALQVPILAKGKIGSWWETPAGIYKIETKEKDHYSSFGDVHMPYSMDFQGNFFIHGWPYYDDGTPVATTYSGGCIRLATDDAEKVYALVDIGMPVLVYNADPVGDQFSYQLKAPVVSGSEYLVADMKNGTVLTSKDPSGSASIASITKLVTALVATEYINLDKTVTVPSSAIVYTTIPRLKAGSDVLAYDLLYLLLQESSNEAAETLASAVGRTQFVEHMNDKAHAIGLTHTLFVDPAGAKEDVSTPEDLFTLLRYINDNRKFVFGITTGDLTDTAYGEPEFGNLENFNFIKNAPGTLEGGKIGQTLDAGETYAGIFSESIGGQQRDIAVIVLGSTDVQSDVARLLTFVHNSYAPGDVTQ